MEILELFFGGMATFGLGVGLYTIAGMTQEGFALFRPERRGLFWIAFLSGSVPTLTTELQTVFQNYNPHLIQRSNLERE